MFYSRVVLAVCGLLAVVCAGCGGSGPKLFPVSGTVTYDGKPLAGASILFIPQGGRPSIGTTDASGKYTISTIGKPGAPAGLYGVTISKTSGGMDLAKMEMPPSDANPSEEEIKKMQEQMSQNMRQMQNAEKVKAAIPTKYSMPEKSGLSATVTDDAAKNVFNFELTP